MTIILYERADHPDIYYDVQWDSDVHCLYVKSEEAALYVPGFEYLRARKEIDTVQVKKLTSIKDILHEMKGDVIVNNSFPYALSQHINAAITVKDTVHESRIIKTEQEITCIEEAQHVTQEAIAIVTGLLEQAELHDGVAYLDGEVLTSEYCKLQARTWLLARGADCPDMIVASGEQTSQPHNRGSGPIKQGPVIIDIFAKARNHYHGDCTRTIILGEDERAEKMLAAVQSAHDACVKKCVPGMNISELHNLANNVLEEHGFSTDEENGFIHSLGHGVGLAVHEQPSVGPRSEGVLKEGMTITIEPGLYYRTGVRYENIVAVAAQPTILGRTNSA